MADDLLLEQVEERPQELRCVKDNGLLIEFSYAVKPYRSAEILFGLSKAGFTPILAHPERYSYFSTSQDDYEELLGYGCRFQLNALSLGGYYGKGALERARYLLQLGQVHFIGTDLHQPRHLQALQNLQLSEELMKLVMENPIENQRL
jgi:protein-tyrosine phosphatase